MTRLQALAARPRRTLGALAVVLAAVGITAGSSATFTASSANPSNTFSSGKLTILNSKEGLAVLNLSNLKPSGTFLAANSGTVDIQNTGTIGGDFTLKSTNLVDPDGLAPSLLIRITDCGLWAGATPNPCGDGNDAGVYTGPLDAMPTSNLAAFAAGDKHTYKFDVRLDTGAPNALQGKTAKVDFNWDASQN